MTLPTPEELLAQGVPRWNIIDRTTHPLVTASSWDVLLQDKKAAGLKLQYHLPHVRPMSVLVACIGNTWEKGTWWRLQDMLLETAKSGYSISLQEFRDPAMFSFEAIAMMRWSAAMSARDGGVEFCLMVDNDVLVEKDTLLRLIQHDRPVVFPWLEDLEKRFPRVIAPLSMPDIIEPGHGLLPVQWAAMSCMLFNARVFNVLEPTAWRGTDFIFAQALNWAGHRIYVDTDTVVKLVKGPTRFAAMSYDEMWEAHRRLWEKRKEDVDRSPPPSFNPLKDDGHVDEYGTYTAMLNHVARGKPSPSKNGREE